MRTKLSLNLSNEGSTLIETMISLAIFGMMVIAIYPAFTQIQKISKTTNTKRLCQQIVNTKLEQYKSGMPVNLPAYQASYASAPDKANLAQLQALSYETYSNGASPTLTGFSYAKIRYNHFFPDACNGQSLATLVTANPNLINPTLGIRECLTSTWGWRETGTSLKASAAPAQCAGDAAVTQELPNFKLYVKLELDTPWKYFNGYNKTVIPAAPGNPTPSLAERLDNSCPNMGNTATGTSSFDFSGQSDAIKVTVTGVIDINQIPLPDLAGATLPQQLTCQVVAALNPYRYPVRYLVTSQSKIFTVHGTRWNGAADGTNDSNADASGSGASNTGNTMVFSNIYQNNAQTYASGTYTSTNSILGISVHPRDAAIWVLRPGLLTRYSNCSGIPINCDLTNPTDKGFPDVEAFINAASPGTISAPGTVSYTHLTLPTIYSV